MHEDPGNARQAARFADQLPFLQPCGRREVVGADPDERLPGGPRPRAVRGRANAFVDSTASVGDFLLGTPGNDTAIAGDPGADRHMVNSPGRSVPGHASFAP
ncbi:hypothetical protein QFZ58_003241 [Streptomyces sp. B1I3]|nr:hypothetical protein [Streptomyces sp. B1I3]